MPAHKRPAAMTADEFRAILDATGLTRTTAADRLGVCRASVFQWLQGYAHRRRQSTTDPRAHQSCGPIAQALEYVRRMPKGRAGVLPARTESGWSSPR